MLRDFKTSTILVYMMLRTSDIAKLPLHTESMMREWSVKASLLVYFAS